MENLELYDKVRAVPDNAKKTISAGRLKGMTDINPMWRIKMLTETFGPCGFGWYIESENHWSESLGNEIAIFSKVALKVKHPQTGEWSAPIIGIGGSKLAGKGKGEGVDDEAYKMAYTDAISIACKNLGVAANIYFAKDRTKYNTHVETPAQEAKQEKTKEVFSSAHQDWQKVLNNLANGKGNLKALQGYYHISPSVEKEILDYLNNHSNKS